MGAHIDIISIDDTYVDILLSYMFPATFAALSETDSLALREAYKNLLNSSKKDYQVNLSCIQRICAEISTGYTSYRS